MQQTAIRFTTHGRNAVVGEFSPGDVARLPERLALNLVRRSGVAEFVDTGVRTVLEPRDIDRQGDSRDT